MTFIHDNVQLDRIRRYLSKTISVEWSAYCNSSGRHIEIVVAGLLLVMFTTKLVVGVLV